MLVFGPDQKQTRGQSSLTRLQPVALVRSLESHLSTFQDELHASMFWLLAAFDVSRRRVDRRAPPLVEWTSLEE